MIFSGFPVAAILRVRLWLVAFLNFNYPFRPDTGRIEKINLNFYFHISLWFLKRFYEGPKGLHEAFLGYHKEVLRYKCKLIFTLINFMKYTGRE